MNLCKTKYNIVTMPSTNTLSQRGFVGMNRHDVEATGTCLIPFNMEIFKNNNLLQHYN